MLRILKPLLCAEKSKCQLSYDVSLHLALIPPRNSVANGKPDIQKEMQTSASTTEMLGQVIAGNKTSSLNVSSKLSWPREDPSTVVQVNTRRFGRATVKTFLARGTRFGIAAHNKGVLPTKALELNERRHRMRTITFGVISHTDVCSLREFALKRPFNIDCLMKNAEDSVNREQPCFCPGNSERGQAAAIINIGLK